MTSPRGGSGHHQPEVVEEASESMGKKAGLWGFTWTHLLTDMVQEVLTGHRKSGEAMDHEVTYQLSGFAANSEPLFENIFPLLDIKCAK